MRVLVEFFDEEPIENVLSSCIFMPDIVVFLCDNHNTGTVKESAIYRLFRRRKMRTRPRFYYFNTSKPETIRNVLRAVVNDYPGCVFDFSGGKDLVLLLAGSLVEAEKIPGYYIDMHRKRFINVFGCDELEKEFAFPSFSAEDRFAMAGATINGYGHFSPDEFTPNFEKDIQAIWQLVEYNIQAWSNFVSWLQACCGGTPANELTFTFPNANRGVPVQPVILQKLHKIGVLAKLKQSNNSITFTIKSMLHRRCLLNQGIWLELYCFITARASGYFSDVRTSVVVDWDGVEGGNENTKNEIDVFLMNGITPVFISCKMNVPTPLALSEICILSTKFGGAHSRTIMLTAASLGNEHRALRMRAADLGAILIDMDTIKNGELAMQLLKAAT